MADAQREKVDDHFDRLLQCDTSQRQPYLARLRLVSEDLADRVEALYADLQAAEAKAFLNTNGCLTDGADLPGRIGPYQVLGILGRGGMGTVFLAKQTTGTRRLVALKLVHRSGNANHLLNHFEREKRLLAFLDHRHITKLYDVGTTNAGEPFFAMEYVRGRPLDQFCDQHKFNLVQRMRLFVQICGAIAHAHQKGVIHRDLKPGNVLVKWEEGVAVPKVIDFGVARMVRTAGRGKATSPATIVGTPAYMSPEQCLGKGDIDTRSDIYSLGGLFYKILVGMSPHELSEGSLPLEKIRQGLDEAILPPSRRLRPGVADDEAVAQIRGTSVSRLNHLLAGDLDRIILKALSFEPDQRYASVLDMARDIESFLDHRPISATPPTFGYRLRRFVRRNRSAVVAITMIFLVVMAGFFATSAALVRANVAGEKARRSATLAREEAAKSQAAFSALQSILAAPDPYVDKRDIRVSELLDRFPDVISKVWVDEETEAALRLTMGQTYTNLGNLDRAETELQKAFDLYACLFGEDHPQTLGTEIFLTRVWSEQGQFEKALASSESTFRRAVWQYGEKHPVVVAALMNLVGNDLEGRQYEAAQPLLEPGFYMALDIYGMADDNSARLMGYIGQTAAYLRDFEVADRYFELAYDMTRDSLGEKHPQTLEIRHNLISMKVDLGQANDFLADAERLVEDQEAVRGPGHPFTLGAMALLGHAQMGAGDFFQARDTFFRLLERGEMVFEPGHPRLAYCYHYLGKACYAAGQYDEALAFIECGVAIEKEVFGEDSLRAAVGHYNIGLVAMELPARQSLAEISLQRAFDIFSNAEDTAGRFFTLQAESAFYRKLGREEKEARVLMALTGFDTQGVNPNPLGNMIVDGVPWGDR